MEDVRMYSRSRPQQDASTPTRPEGNEGIVSAHASNFSVFSGFQDAATEAKYVQHIFCAAARSQCNILATCIVAFIVTCECIRIAPSYAEEGNGRTQWLTLPAQVLFALGCAAWIALLALVRNRAQRSNEIFYSASNDALEDLTPIDVVIPHLTFAAITVMAMLSIVSDATCPWVPPVAASNETLALVAAYDAPVYANATPIGSDAAIKLFSSVVTFEAKRLYCFERLGGDALVMIALFVSVTLIPVRVPIVLATIACQWVLFVVASYFTLSSLHGMALDMEAAVAQLAGRPGSLEWSSMLSSNVAQLIGIKAMIYFVFSAMSAIFVMKRDTVLRAEFSHVASLSLACQEGSELYETLARQSTATLPSHVVRRLLRRRRVRDYVPHAGIMALGIPMFSSWCAHHSSCDIVETLNTMFSILDRELARHPNVTKMQTLGDLYVAVSGIEWAVRNDTSVPPINVRGALAAQDLHRYVLSVQHANDMESSATSTIGIDSNHSVGGQYCVALHSGSITATTFGRTAAYVCVGAGATECVNVLRAHKHSGTEAAAPASPLGPPRPGMHRGGRIKVVSTPAFQACLSSASDASIALQRPKRRTRGDSEPVRLQLEELRQLHQMLAADDNPSESEEAAASGPMPRLSRSSGGVSPSASNNGATVSEDRLFAVCEEPDPRRHLSPGLAHSDKNQAHSTKIPPAPQLQLKDSFLFLEQRYRNEDDNRQFHNFCISYDKDYNRAKWGLALDTIIYALLVVSALSFSVDVDIQPMAAAAILLMCVAAAIPLVSIIIASTACKTFVHHFSSALTSPRGSSVNPPQQQFPVDRASVRFPWVASVVALHASQFLLPPDWVACGGVVTWGAALLWRTSAICVAVRPHVALLVDAVVVCVPLAVIQIVKASWFLRDTPERLFPSQASQQAIVRSFGTDKELTSIAVQTSWVMVLLIPVVMWLVRVVRQEYLRGLFERRQKVSSDAVLIKDQREILQQHIRSVIPKYMQDRFEEYNRNGARFSDQGPIDPWRGTWFATSVQETPILVVQVRSNETRGDADDDGCLLTTYREDPEVLAFAHLEESHQKIDAVLSLMTSVCKAKCAGDIVILIGSEQEEEAVRAMRLLECASAIHRAFSGNVNGPKIVLNSGLAVGAVIGSDRLTFELFGEAVSTSMELLNAMPVQGIVATQKFTMLYRQLLHVLHTCYPTIEQRNSTANGGVAPVVRSGGAVADSNLSAVEVRTSGAASMREASGGDGSLLDLGFRFYLSQSGGQYTARDVTDTGALPRSLIEVKGDGALPKSTGVGAVLHATMSTPPRGLSNCMSPLAVGGSSSLLEGGAVSSGLRQVLATSVPISGSSSMHGIPLVQRGSGQIGHSSSSGAAGENRDDSMGQRADVGTSSSSSSSAFSPSRLGGTPVTSSLSAVAHTSPRVTMENSPQPLPRNASPLILHPPIPVPIDGCLLPTAVPNMTGDVAEDGTVRMGADAQGHRPLLMPSNDPLAHEVQIGGLQLWRVRGCGTVAVHIIHVRID